MNAPDLVFGVALIYGAGVVTGWHLARRVTGYMWGAALSDIPENVSNEWIARHLIDFRDETRRDLRELRARSFAVCALKPT
jgi:hypothetical protein